MLDVGFLVDSYISFSTLSAVSLTLATIVSEETSAVQLILVSLYMMNYFSLAVFKVFLSLALNSFIIMSLDVNLIVFILLRGHGALLMCRLVFLIKFGKFSIINFLNIFSVPFSPFLLVFPSYRCRYI